MTAFISENYQSRPFTVGKSNGRELVYDVQGTEDETEVQTLLESTAPAIYQGLQLESVGAEPQGNGIWKGSARYIRLNDNEYTFDIGGGTRHVTQSLTTINAYALAGSPPDFQGAIGVSEDKVEGVDLPAPEFQFSETHFFSDAAITDSYKFALAGMVGLTMNDNTFRGFAAHECALIGVTGAKRGDERWQLTFRFKGSPNATGLTVGGITGIDKDGHDYLWIRYATFADGSAFSLVQRPVAVYVERVLTPADYSTLGI